MAQGVTVDFNANVERFTSALDRATNDMAKFKSNADRTANSVENAFKALGVGFVIHQLFEASKAAVDLADKMGDLATTTGLSVEQLSGLNLAARQTGTNLDGVANAVAKLSENMGKDPDKFKQIGIDAKDPIEALKQLSDVYNRLEDPQQRAAVASVALGKSWKALAPLLSEGGESIGQMVEKGSTLSGHMSEMAKRADEFNDKVAEMQIQVQGMIVDALLPLLPVLKDVADYIADTSGEAENGGPKFGALIAAFKGLSIVGANVAFVFESLGMLIAGVWDVIYNGKDHQFGAVLKGIDEAEKKLSEFEKKLLNPPEIPAPKIKAPTEPIDPKKLQAFIGGAGASDAAAQAKAILDGHIKDLDNAVKDESELLAVRNKFMDFYYAENLVGTKDYYDTKRELQDISLANTLKLYDAEIALLKAHQSDSGTKETDKINDQNKINDLIEKQNRLRTEGAVSAAFSRLQEHKADEDLQRSLDELNVRYMTMNREMEKAATLSFDLSNRKLREKLESESLTEAQGKLDELRARAAEDASTEGQAGFRRSMRNYVNMANDTAKQIETAMGNAFKGMEDALVSFVHTGKMDFAALVDSIISDLLRISIRQQLLGPLAASLGLGFGGGAPAAKPSAMGNVFTGATRYASGGIFDSPTAFKYADGGTFKLGIMGEAGPEAVMPLKRGADGKLGVQVQGGGSGGIMYAPTINIDSRTDQAEVRRLVERTVQQGNEALLERLRRQRQIS